MQKLRILVSNDDSIHAAGLKALCKVLVAQGHQVCVVAPDKEKSATGHSLTLHRPLRVEQLPAGFIPGCEEIYAIDGTPTDCVKIALNHLLHPKPDLIVSGINHGPNMGADIMYSGTVSVAVEGAIYGVKSVAFSLGEYRDHSFDEPAQHVPAVLEYLSKLLPVWPANTLFNVNIPAISAQECKGLTLTRLGERMYKDFYDERLDPRQKRYYWLSGDLLGIDPQPDSDVTMTAKGFVSITPITFELTNFKLLDELRAKQG